MILALGGRFVIIGSMSLGDFTAFNSYLAILIFPVIVIGFMSNVIAQASASYAAHLRWCCTRRTSKDTGTWSRICAATLTFENVSVTLWRKSWC